MSARPLRDRRALIVAGCKQVNRMLVAARCGDTSTLRACINAGVSVNASDLTLDTALRLARYFGGDAQSWLNLQQAYDLKMAEQSLMKTIMQTVMPYKPSPLAIS